MQKITFALAALVVVSFCSAVSANTFNIPDVNSCSHGDACMTSNTHNAQPCSTWVCQRCGRTVNGFTNYPSGFGVCPQNNGGQHVFVKVN